MSRTTGIAARARVGLQPRAEHEPVHAGHADVEHDRVRRALGGRGPGDGRVGGLLDVDVDSLEGRANEGPEPLIVVYEQ